ncbi:MAG: SpoIIIAH-like family protein [Oscillospiraceae bacterium]|jgi:stage III sporulation protein AH|nr:SpoIIIAH-like family protein [Oscillospiraceae bacterium]
MRQFKRNAVIITVILFVCVAAYLNWSYGKTPAESAIGEESPKPTSDVLAQNPNDTPDLNANPGGVNAPDDETGLYYDNQPTASAQTAYFAEARLARSQARDTAIETLGAINANNGASKETVEAALAKISAIATFSQKEAEIESLVRAKGFSECVVFMSEEGVKVTVPAPMAGLTSVEVAKITDIVTSETDYKAAALTIIEYKAAE